MKKVVFVKLCCQSSLKGDSVLMEEDPGKGGDCYLYHVGESEQLSICLLHIFNCRMNYLPIVRDFEWAHSGCTGLCSVLWGYRAAWNLDHALTEPLHGWEGANIQTNTVQAKVTWLFCQRDSGSGQGSDNRICSALQTSIKKELPEEAEAVFEKDSQGGIGFDRVKEGMRTISISK